MSTTDLINSRKWRCAKCETYLGMDVEISTNRDQDVEMLHFRCHGEESIRELPRIQLKSTAIAIQVASWLDTIIPFGPPGPAWLEFTSPWNTKNPEVKKALDQAGIQTFKATQMRDGVAFSKEIMRMIADESAAPMSFFNSQLSVRSYRDQSAYNLERAYFQCALCKKDLRPSRVKPLYESFQIELLFECHSRFDVFTVDVVALMMSGGRVLESIRPFMRDVQILTNGAAAAPQAPPAPLQTQIHQTTHVRVMKVRD